MQKQSQSKNPRFSVVIPTRNRASTLGSTLQSCLSQNFENYEIVVCDNCSTPETRAIVEKINSEKIVYHRSDKPLSMADNWNLAYSLVKGEYVIYIGDDDALMPFALQQLNLLLDKTKVRAIRWEPVIYAWPNIAIAELAHYLQIPFGNGYRYLDGREVIKGVIGGIIPGPLLPNVYHSLVAREILDCIIAKSGRIFGQYYCDTYSSFAVAYHIDKYITLSTPMVVMGFSGASNNIAFTLMRRKSEVGQNYKVEHAGAQMNPLLPDLPSHLVVLPESFLAAKADLFPGDDTLVLDRRVMLGQLLKHMPIDSLDEWPAAVAEIRRSVSDDPELTAWLEAQLKNTKPKTSKRDSLRPQFMGFSNGRLHLDVKKRGITNVAQAAQFAAKILKAGGNELVVENENFASRTMRKLKIAKFVLSKASNPQP